MADRFFESGVSMLFYSLLIVRLFAVYTFVGTLEFIVYDVRNSLGSDWDVSDVLTLVISVTTAAFFLFVAILPSAFLKGLKKSEVKRSSGDETGTDVEVAFLSAGGLILFIYGVSSSSNWAYVVASAVFTSDFSVLEIVHPIWFSISADLILIVAGVLLVLGPGKISAVLRAIREWRTGKE
jgi:hypothetical protein